MQMRTLVDLLRSRAQECPDLAGYTYLRDGETLDARLTYCEIDERARSTAAALQQIVAPGDRVLLALPPGLDFLAGFFGCLYAGAIAVPVYAPHSARPD